MKAWFSDFLVWLTRHSKPAYLENSMKITEDHWLEEATRDVMPGGSPMRTRRFLVIHFTAGATGRSSIDFWKKLGTGICAHLVIERDGSVTQCRPFDRTCGHAGASQWRDPNTGRLYSGLNACAIGIELANAGNDAPALSWARRQPGFLSIFSRHKRGGPEQEWEAFPPAQTAACERISKALVTRYNLDDLIGHEDIAPDRKSDPGPAFPMQALRNACGFLDAIPKLRV